MKFCGKCGKELMDEAVICPGCGCPVEKMYISTASKKDDEELKQQLQKNLKKFGIIGVVTLCIIVCIYVAVNFVSGEIKKENIIKQIDGEKFVCSKTTTYTYLGAISEDTDTFSFDDEGNCKETNYYYNSYNDAEIDADYDWTYKIKFEKGNAYIVLSNKDRLKVKYEGNEIISLYDVKEKKTYEKD